MAFLKLDPSELPALAPTLSLKGTAVGMWVLDVNDDYMTGCDEWFELYGISCSPDNKIHKATWWSLVRDADDI